MSVQYFWCGIFEDLPENMNPFWELTLSVYELVSSGMSDLIKIESRHALGRR